MRPAIKVGLSTASVYPLRTEAAFEYAAELGYDGVELMVWAETVSQDIGAIAKLSRRYNMPVLSVHAPCLLISQRVWGPNPIPKLTRSVQAAERLGAQTVVVHPPFRWQRRYADGFSEQVAELETRSDVLVAVENMFPFRADRFFGSGQPSIERMRKRGGRPGAAVSAFADQVHARVPAVDVLMNNAGVAIGARFQDTTLEDWRWIVDVNLMGVVHGCRAFVPRMVSRARGGHVVNVASLAGYFASQALAAYSTTKFAVVGLSEALRDELAPAGIGVSAVCPGIIDTPMAHTTELRGADGTDSVLAKLPNPPFSVEEAVEQMLRGVERKRGIIVITREAYALWRLYRVSPEAVLRVNEKTVRFLRRLTGATARR